MKVDHDHFICPNRSEKSNLHIPGKIGRFVKDHPTASKVMAVSIAIIGIAAIVAAPPLAIFSIIPVGAAIAMGLSGALVAGVTLLGHKILEYTIGFSHDMRDHVYAEDKEWKVETGAIHVSGKSKLTYENDIPVFSIQAEDHYSSGFIQGSRLAPEIHCTFERLQPIFTLLRKFKSFPNSQDDDPRFEKMWDRIPGQYREEIKGLVEGYNLWAEENKKYKMNENDVLLFHLLPEIHHFSPSRDAFDTEEAFQDAETGFSELVAELSSTGCTALVTKDNDSQVHFGRNMDWVSHNIADKSLMISRKIGNNPAFVDFSFPLCVGAVSAMNESGLSLTINISPGQTEKYRGTPAVLNNRKFLEQCHSVKEVVEKANEEDFQPNGPYHMTIADGETAGSIHFFQAARNRNGDVQFNEENMGEPTIHAYEGLDPLFPGIVMRKVWEVNRGPVSEVVIANKGYKVKNRRFNPYNHHDSDERTENIHSYLTHYRTQNGDVSAEAVKDAMKLLLINNCETVHHLYLNPENQSFHVALDNNFAGDREMQEVEVDHLFQLFDEI